MALDIDILFAGRLCLGTGVFLAYLPIVCLPVRINFFYVGFVSSRVSFRTSEPTPLGPISPCPALPCPVRGRRPCRRAFLLWRRPGHIGHVWAFPVPDIPYAAHLTRIPSERGPVSVVAGRGAAEAAFGLSHCGKSHFGGFLAC